MYSRPSTPQSIGGVIDDAIRLYRSSFSQWWVPALIFAAIVLAENIVATLLTPGLASPVARPNLLELIRKLYSPRILLIDLLGALVALVCYGALFAAQLAAARGVSSPSTGAAFAASLRRLPRMVLAGLISLLAIVAGTILLVIPGMYVWGRLQLWMVAMFAEDASALEALASSWRLMQSRWWRGSTILTVAFIIMIVLSIAIGAVGGIVAYLAHTDQAARQIIIQLFALPANAIIYPMLSAVWIAMYDDFKLRREGGDLAQRVGALSNA